VAYAIIKLLDDEFHYVVMLYSQKSPARWAADLLQLNTEAL
jgi:hypothetical protein